MKFTLDKIVAWSKEQGVVCQGIPFSDVAKDDYLDSGGYTGVGS